MAPYDRGQVYSLLLFLGLTDFHVCVAGPSFDCEHVVINNTAVKILLDDIEF